MLYQEVYRIWQVHQQSHRSIRSLVAQSLYKNKPQLLALISRVIQHRDLLQTIVDRTELLQKETFLANDLALILIYDQVFGTRVRGKFKGMLKRNQSSIDQCLAMLFKEHNVQSIGELLETTTTASNQSPSIIIPRYVRINLLKTSAKKLRLDLKENSFVKMKNITNFRKGVKRLSQSKYFLDPDVKHVLVFAPETKFFDYDIYINRHILLMDKASCLPCLALSPPPGSTVLDACAAPGNKTICLGNYLKNQGVLYAIEMNKRRYRELNKNLQTAGVTCAKTFNDDFLSVTLPFDEIEYILLDPSCSGSGIRNRNDDPNLIDEKRLERLSSLQTRMVTYALTNFPKVKRVTYSTCSIHCQENEQVVESILDQFSETFQLVDFLPHWPSRGQTERTHACLRASPSDTLTNGFFVACFERIIKPDH